MHAVAANILLAVPVVNFHFSMYSSVGNFVLKFGITLDFNTLSVYNCVNDKKCE